jgi:hypothetical protein
MQMFKVFGGAISKVEVSKTTEDSVWEVSLNGSETRKAKSPKSPNQPAFFETADEAKQALLEVARQGVEVAASRLEAAKRRYQQIADMSVV